MDPEMDVEEQIAAAFTDMKKKKKKKVQIVEPTESAVEDVVEEQQEPVEEDATEMFADMKKKKKKKDIPQELLEGQTQDEDLPVDPSTSMFGKKKKKKKTAFEDFEDLIQEGDAPAAEETQHEEAWLSSNRDYTYAELLTRVFQILRQKNPEIRGEKRTYTIVPPAVSREGTKKTAFSNILDIAKRMRRQPDHVIQFLFAELGTSGSMDGNQRLVIKGRFQPKQIESVLKKYIVEYVSCKTCKSAETMLTKENRLFFVQCESCGSTRSVSTIKQGFQAQIGKRAKVET